MTLADQIRRVALRAGVLQGRVPAYIRLAVTDPDRAARADAVERSLTIPDPTLESYCRQAVDVLDAPSALVSIVTGSHQTITAGHHLPPAVRVGEPVPIAHAVCAYAVAQPEHALLVDDLGVDPIVGGCLAHRSVRAYAGQAVCVDGYPVGAIAVIDSEPRLWTDAHDAALQWLAADVSRALDRRLTNRT